MRSIKATRPQGEIALLVDGDYAHDPSAAQIHDRLTPTHGRGAVSNPSGRFEKIHRHGFDDAWAGDATPATALNTAEDFAAEPLPRCDTVIATERIRSIISRNDSPDIPFTQSVNAYRGCEHGCVYCFARPSHNYLGLSAGLDFETKITAKPNAANVLRTELAKPKYRCAVIAMGTNTDPYQPTERKMGITRSMLEVLSQCNHPVSIVTKNAGVLADIEILRSLAARNLVCVFLSVTTLDANLAGTLEPRASRPARRLRAIETLAQAGVPVGVLTSPMIPGLNDHELEQLLAAAHKAGARYAGYNLLRLPYEVKDLFEQWLHTHAPARAERVLNLMRETQDGKLYDARFGVRGRGTGPYADLIAERFTVARRKLGMSLERLKLDTTQFTPPISAREPTRQLTLL
ncbi:MAG TPA: PA0069 family radical SAM protein [Kofleriaceae bacterium]|nr:PA0069 family radical SAM protein [Kofleriaceae bacterium]